MNVNAHHMYVGMGESWGGFDERNTKGVGNLEWGMHGIGVTGQSVHDKESEYLQLLLPLLLSFSQLPFFLGVS